MSNRLKSNKGCDYRRIKERKQMSQDHKKGVACNMRERELEMKPRDNSINHQEMVRDLLDIGSRLGSGLNYERVGIILRGLRWKRTSDCRVLLLVFGNVDVG